jgi:hypothetical protein
MMNIPTTGGYAPHDAVNWKLQQAHGTVLIYPRQWQVTKLQADDGTITAPARTFKVYPRCTARKDGTTRGTMESPDKRVGERINAAAFSANAGEAALHAAPLQSAEATALAASAAAATQRRLDSALCLKKCTPKDGAQAGFQLYECGAKHTITSPDTAMPRPAMMGTLLFHDCNELGFVSIFGPGGRDSSDPLVTDVDGFQVAQAPASIRTPNSLHRAGSERTMYSATVFDDVCHALLETSGEEYIALADGVEDDDEAALLAAEQRLRQAEDVALGKRFQCRATLSIKSNLGESKQSSKPIYELILHMQY